MFDRLKKRRDATRKERKKKFVVNRQTNSIKRKTLILLTCFGFTKEDRLLSQADFVLLKNTGKKIHSDCFIAQVLQNNRTNSRLGLTISKKTGNAVTRNRLKRLVRERFRTKKYKISGFWDINIIAKKNAAQCSSEKAFSSLDRIFNKISNYCS